MAERPLAESADINAKAENGWTPLHSASYNGPMEVAEKLLASRPRSLRGRATTRRRAGRALL